MTEHRLLIRSILPFLATGAALIAADPEGEGDGGEASFQQLVKFNGEALFGGKLSVEKDRFTLTFPGKGLFHKGFECKGRGGFGVISDHGHVKNESVKKSLFSGIDKLDQKFSFVGLASGQAISKFQLEDEFKISFKLRPNIQSRYPRLALAFFPEKSRNALQVELFPEIRLTHKRRRSTPKDAAFRGIRWVDQQSVGVPVEIIVRGGKATVRIEPASHDQGKKRGRRGGRGGKERKEEKNRKDGEGKNKEAGLAEVVTLEDVEETTEGRLVLSFANVNFLVSDFRIEGKLPRRWLEKEFDRLRREGRLRTESAEGGKAGGKEEQPKLKKKDTKEKEGPDLDKPDPEADEEL